MFKEDKTDFVSGANRPVSMQTGFARGLLVGLAILSVVLLAVTIVKYFALRTHGVAFDNTNAMQPSGWMNPSAGYNGGGRPRQQGHYGSMLPRQGVAGENKQTSGHAHALSAKLRSGNPNQNQIEGDSNTANTGQ